MTCRAPLVRVTYVYVPGAGLIHGALYVASGISSSPTAAGEPTPPKETCMMAGGPERGSVCAGKST